MKHKINNINIYIVVLESPHLGLNSLITCLKGLSLSFSLLNGSTNVVFPVYYFL